MQPDCGMRLALVVALLMTAFGGRIAVAQVVTERTGFNQPDVIDDASSVTTGASIAVFADGLPGAFRQIRPKSTSATATWLAGGGNDGLGSTQLDLSTTFFAPFPWIDHSLVSVSPGFGVQFLDGPAGVALPSEVYRGSLTFSLMKPINERTQLMFGLAPSFATDFQNGSSDAFRFLAFASLAWQKSPTTKWTFGVAATGRDDVPVLPMAGFTWTPNEDWQIDVAAPRPRIAHRVDWFDVCHEDWVYVAGEFGGGTWAVDRAGTNDVLTIRDFRLVLGWERKGIDGVKPRIEAGYVFGRKIEYESDDFDFDPSNTVMIRAGLSF